MKRPGYQMVELSRYRMESQLQLENAGVFIEFISRYIEEEIRRL